MTTTTWKDAKVTFHNTRSDTGAVDEYSPVQATSSMESFGHNIAKLGTSKDLGGPWLLKKNTSTYTIATVKTTVGSTTFTKEVAPTIPSSLTLPWGSLERSNSEMDALGASLLASVDPTKPVFSASTALGELRKDGLPDLPGVQLWKGKTHAAKHSGGEYLNYQFGWLPMAADIKDLVHAVRGADQIIGQYRARANMNHHFLAGDAHPRRTGYVQFNGPTSSITGSGVTSTSYPSTGYAYTTERIWCEGVYRYYLPMGNDKLSKLRRIASYARRLYGIELSPDVVWNLAPWSWAADWFGNMGDVMENISSFGRDQFAYKYCYVMSEKAYIRTVSNSVGAVQTQSFVIKQRRPANPFGFGVDFDGLSARQIAILAALGLSRGR